MATERKPFATFLRPDRRVESGEVSLQPVGNGGITGSIPVEKARHAGVDIDDPGTREWHYVREKQLLIIDLGGEFSGDA